jgi:hypothetical protein
MKDKRTYTKLKEHGEDMTHENESKVDPKENRNSGISLFIEQHKKQIWEYQQKESEWIKTENLNEGYKKIIDELSTKIIEQEKIIKLLEKELEDKNK